jgi:fluoroacetyl-CoA thioesterase
LSLNCRSIEEQQAERLMSVKSRTAEASLRALPPDSAEATHLSPQVDFPAVPATVRMIELMEIAAARLLRPRLNDGEASVTVSMNVTYAATNLRQTGSAGPIRAVASYIGTSGRLHRFTINAFDETGLIGTAEHARAVVVERRLVAIARDRAGKPGMLLMV